jgi:hypothetical protein
MFRRSDYAAVGGYREEFYFAQDLDLWTRLIEKGRHGVVPEVLYRAILAPSSISGRYASEQRQLKGLIAASSTARRRGDSDQVILRQARLIRPRGETAPTAIQKARGNYFLGCCLQKSNRAAARQYFAVAARENPLHLKAWIKLLLTSGCGISRHE